VHSRAASSWSLAHRIVALACIALCWSAPARAGASEKLSFPLRTKTLTLTVYRPEGPPKGTILMGSGDAGWIGLAVNMSEPLVQDGFIVIGFNVREYLSSFTAGAAHISPDDARSDYREMSALLAAHGLLRRPVLLSGVSEGAALAVVAAGDPRNRTWIDGVVTMGLPARAELAWRWMDLTALIRRKDLDEPSFTPSDYVGAVSPIPLAMIQSTTDEYATDADRARLLTAAKPPREMVLIDAANHRFTDKLPELRTALRAAIQWVTTVTNSSR
jgi:type IV secretory pathway VirJ component